MAATMKKTRFAIQHWAKTGDTPGRWVRDERTYETREEAQAVIDERENEGSANAREEIIEIEA